jgi:AraC-like DNA-binding protein
MENENFFPYRDSFTLTVNNENSPLFYSFEFDSRAGNIMEIPHFHKMYELYILLEGEISSHTINGDYYPINKFDIVLLPPFLLHKTEYSHRFTHRRLLVQFSIPVGDPYLDSLIHPLLTLFDAKIPIYRLPEDKRNRLFQILSDILKLKIQGSPLIDLLVHAKFLEFLCGLYELRKKNLYIQQPHTNNSIQRIYNLTSYIHTNYSQHLSLESLSQRINTSPYYLSHIFKKVTGFPLVNYIQIIRIRNAQQLLLSTNMRISDISAKCGFSSFSQFNRVFRKYCTISPSSFRKNGSGKENLPDLILREQFTAGIGDSLSHGAHHRMPG